ncbi:hypothetical protein [Nosocomiicoccus sp. HMSC09A07]|nr:hypothetical protein [Nosocomiicoccus sp. HMSC09A07]
MKNFSNLLKLPKEDIKYTVKWSKSNKCIEKTTKKISDNNDVILKLN